MNGTFTLITIVLYLLSAFLLGRRLFTKQEAAEGAQRMIPLTLGLVAAAFHGMEVHSSIFTAAGFDFSFFNMLSLVAWLVSLLVLLSALSLPVENVAIFTMPIAAIADGLHGAWANSRDVLHHVSIGIEIHITLSLLAYSLLSIAAVQALLLAIQDYHLRNRHPGGFIRALPPLETGEALLFDMLGLGMVVLSFALISGGFFVKNIFAQHIVHKTVLSIIAWGVFATLLWGRWRFGWRGRKAIRWTLAGFGTLMLAYFGSKFVLEMVLGKSVG